jgi:hypothetical protein
LDGRIGFVVFYIAFLSLLIAVATFVPLTILSGISQSDLDNLINVPERPSDPNIAEALIYQFTVGLSWLSGFFSLMGASSSYQFVAVIMAPLTIGFIACVYSLIRSG